MFPVPVYVGSAEEPKNGPNKVTSEPKFPILGVSITACWKLILQLSLTATDTT